MIVDDLDLLGELLAQACAWGDPERIAEAARDLDDADERARSIEADHRVPMLAAALWYAEQGIPVLPLAPGAKLPRSGTAGSRGATLDPAQVRAWWGGNGDLNIGLATGHRFDVVDIDGPTGQASRAQHWVETFARIDADAVAKVLTPRPGGMHIYVPATGGSNNSHIVPGVDYRGLGGYVVAPPSSTAQGAYRFLGRPRLGDLATPA